MGALSYDTLFPSGSVVNHPPASAGDSRDAGSVPGPGGSPGGGNGDPLQYSCLENPMDREALQTTVHAVAKTQTRLKQLSPHASSDMKFIALQGP